MKISISRNVVTAGVAFVAIMASGCANVNGIAQSGEQKNMRLVGHSDLQGRFAYQPNTIVYPDGRTIAFVGTHTGTKPNPLKGGAVEPNGTMIVDVTHPEAPVDLAHIPVPIVGGQAQMARMCLGSQLPGGEKGHVYLMRSVQDSAASGFEVWDVTDPKAAVLSGAMRHIRATHKPYWECSTGIAYLPGSPGPGHGMPLWRQPQSMMIVDWSKPSAPSFLRMFGLPGAQPSGTGPVPTSLHGAISAHDHPNAKGMLARGATSSDIIGNRVYAAWGVGNDGVMQALDRSKLLPPPFGTYTGDRNDPTNAQLLEPQTSILYLSPDQGGHTTMPVFGMKPKSMENFSTFQTRDILIMTSEATNDLCKEAPHWGSIVDITVENSKTSPPGTKVEPNPWQGPMLLSSMAVDPHLGEKYPRGNYCTRGARFGSHAIEENFNNPFYGKLTFMSYFAGGIRMWDIREPQSPVEIGFYVPLANSNTVAPGYMSNNVEVDDRGYVYSADRNGGGLDIIRVTGSARRIAYPNEPLTSGDD
jgi:hypothetical protein